MTSPTLHVAIPCMNEAEFLPSTMDCLLRQTKSRFIIWVCVNQPDIWWDDPLKNTICINNHDTLQYLHKMQLPNLRILDHSSRGNGWKEKNTGVGQARKVLMDVISQEAENDDIIVSLDADTLFNDNYLSSILECFNNYPFAIGLSNPYYHHLTGNEILDRAMLRYEIYMRNYAINMWEIDSPYNFTALGSAISLPVGSYKKIGGMTPKKSGEDFYFLQKLTKTGKLLNFNKQVVYPGTRFSDRVFFGTGPALIKGSQGNWSSYPIYHYRLFEQVQQTYESFPELFRKSFETPMSSFLQKQFRCEDIFEALRQNSKTEIQFIKACHVKIDGLRILQFLKISQKQGHLKDEKNLKDNFKVLLVEKSRKLTSLLAEFRTEYYKLNNVISAELLEDFLQNHERQLKFIESLSELDFKKTSIDTLNFIRNFQYSIESLYQQMDQKNAFVK